MKRRWIGNSKLYLSIFRTCDGATCTQCGMSTLCRDLAGRGLKSSKVLNEMNKYSKIPVM